MGIYGLTKCARKEVFEEYVWGDSYGQRKKQSALKYWCYEGIGRKSRAESVEVVWSCGENGRGLFG